MRLLYITPYIPNLLRTRPYYLLKNLASQHAITLVAPYFSPAEFEDSKRLAAEIPGLTVVAVAASKRLALFQSLKALFRREPMQAYYCYSPLFITRCRELIAAGSYDLIHVEHFRVAFSAKELASSGIPIVYDAVDSISLLVERTLKYGPLKNRLISLIELNPTRRYEASLLNNGLFQAACATSAEDAQTLEKLALARVKENKKTDPISVSEPGQEGPASLAVKVIPNGVDLSYFTPPSEAESPRDPETVLFSGKMSYHANIAAARFLVQKIWPLVRQERPAARLQLVGSDPPADLLKLNGQQGIEVTGFVADMRPYLQKAAVAVAPMVYSVGIQNKVLEAMACATPVVATGDIYRGIEAENGQDLFLVTPDQPAEFARQIVALLNDPARATTLGQNGRARVVQAYSWDKAARSMEQFWQEAAATNKPAATPEATPSKAG